ncbi:MAG: hypothetical protein COB46_08795 [Rhodospirillaceae bacterium]|nr:MAG: hypothetical protein COB46_08795 [Rhodospirillaceae bacterium]
MALTRKMFLNTLPRALDTADYTVDGEVVTLTNGGQIFEITFSEKANFKLGGFSIPRADVTLKLTGYSDDDADVAVKRFERYFHRGGG